MSKDKCDEHSGHCQALETLEKNDAEQYTRIHELETEGCAVGRAVKDTLDKIDKKLTGIIIAAFGGLLMAVSALIVVIVQR